MDAKHYIGKQKDITRNMYNKGFIVSQEPQGKSFLDNQNAETHE